VMSPATWAPRARILILATVATRAPHAGSRLLTVPSRSDCPQPSLHLR
jgi:hypothetical protein